MLSWFLGRCTCPTISHTWSLDHPRAWLRGITLGTWYGHRDAHTQKMDPCIPALQWRACAVASAVATVQYVAECVSTAQRRRTRCDVGDGWRCSPEQAEALDIDVERAVGMTDGRPVQVWYDTVSPVSDHQAAGGESKSEPKRMMLVGREGSASVLRTWAAMRRCGCEVQCAADLGQGKNDQ